jgi:hypothetical protein
MLIAQRKEEAKREREAAVAAEAVSTCLVLFCGTRCS